MADYRSTVPSSGHQCVQLANMLVCVGIRCPHSSSKSVKIAFSKKKKKSVLILLKIGSGVSFSFNCEQLGLQSFRAGFVIATTAPQLTVT